MEKKFNNFTFWLKWIAGCRFRINNKFIWCKTTMNISVNLDLPKITCSKFQKYALLLIFSEYLCQTLSLGINIIQTVLSRQRELLYDVEEMFDKVQVQIFDFRFRSRLYNLMFWNCSCKQLFFVYVDIMCRFIIHGENISQQNTDFQLRWSKSTIFMPSTILC